MKATDFEYRYQTLLHLLLAGLAVGAYSLSSDDIVWVAVRHHTSSAFLEQIVFGIGALMLLCCAMVETWAEAYGGLRYLLLFGRVLLVLAVGLLLPVAGTVLLLGGESLLVLRLFARYRTQVEPARRAEPNWGQALRRAVSKWGLTASMIAFTFTLQDRIAEIGAALSVTIWLALNSRRLPRRVEIL